MQQYQKDEIVTDGKETRKILKICGNGYHVSDPDPEKYQVFMTDADLNQKGFTKEEQKSPAL